MLCRCGATLFVVLLYCAPQGCTHPRAHMGEHSGTQAVPKTDPAAQDTGLAAGTVLAMGPSGLTLPVFLGPSTDDERRFSVAASRALRMVYEEDSDDASALLALQHRLDVHEAPQSRGPIKSSTFQAAWRPILQAGLIRAATLQDVAQGLRALRQAYANVYLEDGTGALRNLHRPACSAALQQLLPLQQSNPEFIITIEPMGPKSLQSLLAPCNS